MTLGIANNQNRSSKALAYTKFIGNALTTSLPSVALPLAPKEARSGPPNRKQPRRRTRRPLNLFTKLPIPPGCPELGRESLERAVGLDPRQYREPIS